MIIQCQGCAAKYFLPEDRVPKDSIKVRCPQCTAVFTLSPRFEPARETVPATASIAAEAIVSPASVAEPVPFMEPETVPAPAVEDKPRTKRGRSKEDRAKRLARVLVSDILEYNRDKRNIALKEGQLMNSLGDEIKKSWELYKDKVGPDVAGSTEFFKEALNEILADGKEVF
jgi:predicted Zn finger-like uncharacterized protein